MFIALVRSSGPGGSELPGVAEDHVERDPHGHAEGRQHDHPGHLESAGVGRQEKVGDGHEDETEAEEDGVSSAEHRSPQAPRQRPTWAEPSRIGRTYSVVTSPIHTTSTKCQYHETPSMAAWGGGGNAARPPRAGATP